MTDNPNHEKIADAVLGLTPRDPAEAPRNPREAYAQGWSELQALAHARFDRRYGGFRAFQAMTAGMNTRDPDRVFRMPIGILFARADREGEGAQIADQIRASLQYWHLDSADAIDFFLPGWMLYRREWPGPQRSGTSEQSDFDVGVFHDAVQSFERQVRWAYSGETDLVLAHYAVTYSWDAATSRPVLGPGAFDFSETILLPIEAMLRENRLGSIDELMRGICREAREAEDSLELSAIWQISDALGLQRGRKAAWDAIKKLVLRDFSNVYDQARPYVVCNLTRRVA